MVQLRTQVDVLDDVVRFGDNFNTAKSSDISSEKSSWIQIQYPNDTNS